MACQTTTCSTASSGTDFTSHTTRIDATPPSGTMQINGGAAATNNRDVTLSLAAADPLIGEGLFCGTLLGSFIEGNRSAEATDEILLDTVKPVAVATPGSASIERGSAVTLSAGASTDAAPASGVVAPSAVWTFADGTPAQTGATVTHTFSATGTFVGSLRVKDAAGNLSDPKAVTVVVAPKPGETFNGSGSIAGVRGTAAFSVSRLRVRARYVRSRLKGSVSLVGASTQAGRLRIAVRRGARGKVLRAASSRIGATAFTRSVTLPATLLPGRYTLTLTGAGGTLITQLTGATVTAGLPAGARVSTGTLRATLRAGAIVVGSATARVR